MNDFLLVRHCKYSSILYHFLSYLTLNNIVTLKSGLEVTQVIQTGTIRKVGYGFLFAFHSNYGSILHYFRDKARYFSKIVIFHTPLHSTPPLGGPRRNIAIPFGTEILEWRGYLTVKKFEDLFSGVHIIPACDRRTDRQTSCHVIVRAMHTRRAVKNLLDGRGR